MTRLAPPAGHPPLIDHSDSCSFVELETRHLASFRHRNRGHALSPSSVRAQARIAVMGGWRGTVGGQLGST
jgi:hypothetical protein